MLLFCHHDHLFLVALVAGVVVSTCVASCCSAAVGAGGQRPLCHCLGHRDLPAFEENPPGVGAAAGL